MVFHPRITKINSISCRFQGYRLYKVSGYSEGNQPRYAGIWYKQGGNRWQARHGVSASAYQQAMTDLADKGYRPTHVSVFTIGDEFFFSAIWEQEVGLDWKARHDLSSSDYQQLFNELSGKGWRLRCVSGYEVAGDARYACIWDRYAGPAWEARHGLDAAQYQREFDDLNGRGYRLIQVAGYPVAGTARLRPLGKDHQATDTRPGMASRLSTTNTSSTMQLPRDFDLPT